MYGTEILHLVVITIITYIFISYFGRKISAFYILIYSMLHLSCVQIRNMIKNYGGWEIDVTTILMMSICKFSSIAFSYEDGGKEDSAIRNSYHRANKIVEKPTLLEVFSYIFFYPSCVVGPSFEFADFRKFIYQEGVYKNIPKDAALRTSFIEFGKGIICIVLFQVGKSFYDLEYLISDQFDNHNLFIKFLLYNYVMSTLRAKYYVCWKLGQATTTACGLSYAGSTKGEGEIEVHKFDKINTCGIQEVETHMNVKVKMQYWNRTVHFWLKYNVFLRVVNINHPLFKDNIGMASLVTFFVSAFWHGFYPAYYICFVIFYFIEQWCEMAEKHFNFFEKLSKLPTPLHQICLVLSMSIPDYLGIVFSLLQISHTFKFMKSMYFIPNILFILPYFVLPYLIKAKKRREAKEASKETKKEDKSTTKEVKQE